MPQHIIANITWQENYWTGAPTAADMQRAGHRYVSGGQVGHEYLNFNLERDVKDGYKIGFFQATRQPTRFSNGTGYVFFYSGGYIVGIYGQAEIGAFKRTDPPPHDSNNPGNVRAPVDKVGRFKDIRLLKANPQRHFDGRERVGQIGFIYIGDETAKAILDDAIALHEVSSPYRAKLEQLRSQLDTSKLGRSIWKIAPGEQADLWPQCQEKKCIAIGWSKIGDFRQYQSEKDIATALGVANDDRSQNAKTIWRFTREVASGDIVVANRGRSNVVGIGLIVSDYIPPEDPRNPNLSRLNARLVDWKITEEVELPFTFAIPTVMPISREQWQQIKQVYLSQNPALQRIFDEIEGKSTMLTKDTLLEEAFTTTRNVILYGPPGTGKTYRARRFAAAWTKGQISQVNMLPRNYWCVVANPREWHWDTLFGQKQIQGFYEGNLARNYAEIKPGDLVFGYLARPDKQLYCLAEVVSPPAQNPDGYAFFIKGLKKIAQPIPWQVLRDDPVLQNSEPMRIQMRGTLLRFEPHEATHLRELIEDKNPALADLFENYWSGKSAEYVRTVTFHQSYGYEDFIEGLRPIPDPQGNIRYEWRSGIFKQVCDEAAADPDNDFILIIDEINRGNIAKIFGELITLLEDDKRLGQANEMMVILPGSQQRFGIPDNLYVLGAMNTADRSIALLDIALRRRFTFVEIEPEAELLNGKEVEGIQLNRLLERLNTRIEVLLDRDHRLGHSYFMDVKTSDDLYHVWYNKIIPMLQEYFYNDGERLRAVLDDFVELTNLPQNLFANPPENFDPELTSYQVMNLTGTQFIAALKKIAGLV